MIKNSLVAIFFSIVSLPSFANLGNMTENDQAIESTECTANPQSCRNLSGLADLKKICTNYATADRQLPPSKFEYQCRMCWTDWRNAEAASPISMIQTKQSNFITNKGKFSWSSTQSAVASLSCLVSKEVIYQLDELVSVDLANDLNCKKIMTFNSDKEFHAYLEDNFCTKSYLQQQGLDIAPVETGRSINTCESIQVQTKGHTKDVLKCPSFAAAADVAQIIDQKK